MKKSEDTVSLITVIWSDKDACDRYLKLLMDAHYFCHKSGFSLVNFHKKKFGKQKFCFNGEFRFWVWDIDILRLYISNQKGVCFEVKAGTTKQDAMQALEKYYETLTK